MRIRWTWHGAVALTITASAAAQTPAAPLAPSSASASAPPAPPARRDAPAGRPSSYSATVSKGHAAMAARNIPAATEAYRAAMTADPRDALVVYFLGEAQVAQGELAQADASFTSALTLPSGRAWSPATWNSTRNPPR
jgi:predicted Zn-dependent protease